MVKQTFIKILGPPILSAIKALEEVAVSMPDVCIMDTIITNEIPRSLRRGLGGQVMGREFKRDPRIAEFAYGYYRSSGVVINRERCESIFSQSGASLGDFDFYFEWTKKITSAEYEEFLGKIDEKLAPLGCFYSIMNK
jgi:hypothetical protein